MSNPNQPLPEQPSPPPLPEATPVTAYTSPPGGHPHQLAYMTVMADGGGRPGLIMALGVTSIVFGAIQVLYALGSAVSTLSMTATMASVRASMATTGATTMSTTTTSGSTIAYASSTASVPSFSMTGVQIGWLIASIASAALSVLLIIAGIQTVRYLRIGRRLHMIWLPLKVTVETVGAVLYGLLMAEMMSGMGATFSAASGSSGSPPPPMLFSWMAIITAAIQWGLSMAYPLAVAIVLTRRSIKRYFDTVV